VSRWGGRNGRAACHDRWAQLCGGVREAGVGTPLPSTGSLAAPHIEHHEAGQCQQEPGIDGTRGRSPAEHGSCQRQPAAAAPPMHFTFARHVGMGCSSGRFRWSARTDQQKRPNLNTSDSGPRFLRRGVQTYRLRRPSVALTHPGKERGKQVPRTVKQLSYSNQAAPRQPHVAEQHWNPLTIAKRRVELPA
jgi:hypothetical protein